MRAGIMPYSHNFYDEPAWILVAEVLDELDVQDQAFQHWTNVTMRPPILRRQRAVRFMPTPIQIDFDQVGSRNNPIIIE